MKRWTSYILAATAWFALSAAGAAEPVEGKDYVRLKNPQPTETGKKIEVIEFFSYGCPHCNDLEPILDAWLAKLPPDVQFRRVPVRASVRNQSNRSGGNVRPQKACAKQSNISRCVSQYRSTGLSAGRAAHPFTVSDTTARSGSTCSTSTARATRVSRRWPAPCSPVPRC